MSDFYQNLSEEQRSAFDDAARDLSGTATDDVERFISDHLPGVRLPEACDLEDALFTHCDVYRCARCGWWDDEPADIPGSDEDVCHDCVDDGEMEGDA